MKFAILGATSVAALKIGERGVGFSEKADGSLRVLGGAAKCADGLTPLESDFVETLGAGVSNLVSANVMKLATNSAADSLGCMASKMISTQCNGIEGEEVLYF